MLLKSFPCLINKPNTEYLFKKVDIKKWATLMNFEFLELLL